MNRMGLAVDRRGWPLRVTRHRYTSNARRPVAGLMHPASCSSSKKRKIFVSTKREEEKVHVGNEYATGRLLSCWQLVCGWEALSAWRL